MAIAAGLCAGGNYFNQPLLDSIAGALSVAPATAAVSVTVAQVAYGAGLLLLVPLGDLLDRRKLAVGLMLLAAAGQALSGWSPNIATFLTGTAVAGAFSVAAQVLVPFAASLADPARSGRAVGTMMSGLLVGILVARSAAGLVSTLGGWTTIYRIAGALMIVVALALWKVLPDDSPSQRTRIGYGEALRSLGSLVARYPRLRTRAMLGATTFAAVSAVFATMALLLSRAPFGYSPATIGLIGLSGVAGAVAASAVGRLADRGLAQWASFGGLVLLLVCWPLFGFLGAHSVAWFVVSFVVADLALQSVHISNQNIVFALEPQARSRMNSVYMTAYFVGAAAGSAVGTTAWRAGGWTAVCVAGAALSMLSFAVWAVDLRATRRPVTA
ncbi:MFS transporter [Rhodococcus sp. HNM0569]|uniref:MFS transporter n=1 Tax=Rhodococcus sp. HNM0569 TaxID=2716340 RepID=UPI00146EE105|nr:MFS transporter [Rhodococcus sp. HNM0569]NLU82754.1 MFS transporter [Rhodococcus sp. HNM0569]